MEIQIQTLSRRKIDSFNLLLVQAIPVKAVFSLQWKLKETLKYLTLLECPEF